MSARRFTPFPARLGRAAETGRAVRGPAAARGRIAGLRHPQARRRGVHARRLCGRRDHVPADQAAPARSRRIAPTSSSRAALDRQDHADQRAARRVAKTADRVVIIEDARAAMRRAQPRRHADQGRRRLALRSGALVAAPAPDRIPSARCAAPKRSTSSKPGAPAIPADRHHPRRNRHRRAAPPRTAHPGSRRHRPARADRRDHRPRCRPLRPRFRAPAAELRPRRRARARTATTASRIPAPIPSPPEGEPHGRALAIRACFRRDRHRPVAMSAWLSRPPASGSSMPWEAARSKILQSDRGAGRQDHRGHHHHRHRPGARLRRHGAAASQA